MTKLEAEIELKNKF